MNNNSTVSAPAPLPVQLIPSGDISSITLSQQQIQALQNHVLVITNDLHSREICNTNEFFNRELVRITKLRDEAIAAADKKRLASLHMVGL